MNRNRRKLHKANHGKRPCNQRRRKSNRIAEFKRAKSAK